AGVDVVPLVDRTDDGRSVIGVLHHEQLAAHLVGELARFRAGTDDASRFAAAKVEVDLSDAHRVRARSRPVDVLPEGAAPEQVIELLIARSLALEVNLALLDQPGIEVE